MSEEPALRIPTLPPEFFIGLLYKRAELDFFPVSIFRFNFLAYNFILALSFFFNLETKIEFDFFNTA